MSDVVYGEREEERDRPDEADEDGLEFDCHMRPDGQCGKAGSEEWVLT
jgi:hypothetical protein